MHVHRFRFLTNLGSARTYYFYSAFLDLATVNILDRDSKNPIVTVELLGVLAAMALRRNDLRGTASICFVDDDAAKSGLIRGGSSAGPAAALINASCDLEIEAEMLVFYERVPSSSNIPDAPNRGQKPASLPG